MSERFELPDGRRPLVPVDQFGNALPAFAGPQYFQQEPIPQESLLRHYWRVAYRNRWIILAVTVACLLAALLISMLMQRHYTASVRVQIAREAAKVVNVDGAEATEEGGRDLEFYQTQYALLKSRTLSEAVVRDLRLADNFSFLTNYNESRIDDFRAMPRQVRFKRATEIVNRHTNIAPLAGSSVVDIKYVAANPAMAATVANSIADNFIETNLARRFDATTYAREFLQNRINATRAKLEESERKAASYAQAQGIIKVAGEANGEGRISSEQTLASADLTQLSAQLAAARSARVQAEADYRANTGGSAATSSLSNVAVNQLRGQRAALSGELSKLLSDFGPEYPRVAALRSQINELDEQIAREQGRVTTSVARGLADRYRQALAAEQGLQARVNGLKSAVLDQQQRSIQYNIIQRDVDTNRALYDALLQRFKEIGVAGGVGTNNVSIVDPALPPDSPSTPNLPLNLALGMLFGVMMGGGIALVREQLADSVILPGEFQQKLGIKLLGTTPKVSDDEIGEQLAQQRSELSEAYFSILTAIQFAEGRKAPATMLFTSTQGSEGKSTTAFALARSLASVGSKVLLIDGDLRNPTLHRILNRPMSAGLSDLLAGAVQVRETFHSLGTTGMAVMLAGRVPLNPAELLSTNALDEILDSVRDQFDHVIIDGPPVLGLADSVLYGRACDATVFIIEAGRTRASQALLALDRLRAVRAEVIGAVLTKLDAKEQGYGENYGYNYRYGRTSKTRLLSFLNRG